MNSSPTWGTSYVVSRKTCTKKRSIFYSRNTASRKFPNATGPRYSVITLQRRSIETLQRHDVGDRPDWLRAARGRGLFTHTRPVPILSPGLRVRRSGPFARAARERRASASSTASRCRASAFSVSRERVPRGMQPVIPRSVAASRFWRTSRRASGLTPRRTLS
jgi:hypothetical protein